MKKLLLPALAIACAVLVVDAEVLVYDLSFNATGPSVNYSFLQGGFLVVDSKSSAVTSLVTLVDPQTDLLYYTTGVLSGTYMEMVQEGSKQEYGVISSTSGSGGDAENIAFQVLGKTSRGVGIGAGNSLSLPRNLKGYLLASAAESRSTDTNNVTTTTFGFAGNSKVTANFQSGLTQDANNSRLDSAGAITRLTEVLVNRGVVPQPSASPTASPNPSASPSPTVSPNPTATPSPTATP